MEQEKNQLLYSKLKEYSEKDFYPFHMPGHKRQILFDKSYSIDITEIDGFDDLHHPDGILKEKMEKAAEIYGADQSFYLINGSTGGILSAISAVTEIGDEILVARNCHKSVFHAVFLRKLIPYYVYPQVLQEKWINGGIAVDDVENELKIHSNIKAVVIVSPTYEGIVSDIQKIAEVCHNYKIPLIVDEAHGAHFRYDKQFPVSALECGADLVIQSLHKTLPAMTQTGILHKKGDFVSEEKLKFYLQVYQTSSPSYVLMASMDACLEWMLKDGIKYMESYRKRLDYVYGTLEQLNYIWYLSKEWIGKCNVTAFDPSKLVFGSKLRNWSGKRMMELLRNRYHLEMEMCTPNYVIAMTSVMDTDEGMKRLTAALQEMDEMMKKELEQCLDEKEREQMFESENNMRERRLENHWNDEWIEIDGETWKHQMHLCPYEASLKEKELVPLKEAAGRICAEASYIYPPGIPFFMPGEVLEKKDIEKILYYKECGFQIQGGFHEKGNNIYVIK